MGSPSVYSSGTRLRPRLGVTSHDQKTIQGARIVDHDQETSPGNTYTINPCRAKRCLTCATLVTDKVYTSNVTNRSYPVINHSNENLNCKSQNLVYLISCIGCGIQYIGETTTPLNIGMNTHRKSEIGCQYMIDHFKGGCPGKEYGLRVQIIEKFKGNGYRMGLIDNDDRNNRLKIEDNKIKIMRTVYPYGLNSRIKNKKLKSDDLIIGKLFPNLPRLGIRPKRTQRRINKNKDVNKEEFL